MSGQFVGEIKLVGFNFAPRGYVFCNGALIAIQQNAAMFSLLGTTFGGNGTVTFGVPDFRGRIPVGQGQGPGLATYVQGQMAGTENTTILLSNLPPHTHALTGSVSVATTVSTTATAGTQPKPGGNLLAKGLDSSTSALMNNYSNVATDGTALGGVASTVTSTLQVGLAGSGLPISTLQPYLGTNYIIATEGIFPSRN